jgi:hypothetical protein
MSDERTPLLNPPRSDEERPDVPAEDTSLNGSHHIDASKSTTEEIERGSVLSIVVYILATLIVLILVVAILVGYINTADKDVSCPIPRYLHSHMNLTPVLFIV